jgi:glycosyltransferase involved in cell wall biosynthesis
MKNENEPNKLNIHETKKQNKFYTWRSVALILCGFKAERVYEQPCWFWCVSLIIPHHRVDWGWGWSTWRSEGCKIYGLHWENVCDLVSRGDVRRIFPSSRNKNCEDGVRNISKWLHANHLSRQVRRSIYIYIYIYTSKYAYKPSYFDNKGTGDGLEDRVWFQARAIFSLPRPLQTPLWPFLGCKTVGAWKWELTSI